MRQYHAFCKSLTYEKNMTNTRLSDCEVLEKRFPVLIKQFSIRHGSGGTGLHPGGNGAIRGFEARAKMNFSLSSERRAYRPYGMAGGSDGASGRNLALLKLRNGGGERWVNAGGRGIIQLQCGEQLYVHTPGGGGYGEEVSGKQTHGDGESRPPQYWRGMGSWHEYATTQREG